MEHVLVDSWIKQATVGAIRIGSYSGSWDVAEALQPMRAWWLPTSHRSRKRVEYREVKYWGCRISHTRYHDAGTKWWSDTDTRLPPGDGH